MSRVMEMCMYIKVLRDGEINAAAERREQGVGG